MKVYLDTGRAPNPRRLRMYLIEKGLDLPIEEVDLRSGFQRTEEFTSRNPFAGVPILELDDGTVLAESTAIMEYLEEAHPEPPLIGTDAVSRARVRQWDRRCEIGVYLNASRMTHSQGEASEAARRVLAQRLALVERAMEGPEWVAGQFSIADITLFVGVETARHGGFELDPEWKQLARWYEAMGARPSARARGSGSRS